MSKNATTLENVDFSHVDCSGVIFSRATFNSAKLGLVGKNLGFVSAKLAGASFDGAILSWTDYKESKADWYEDGGEDDDGRPRPVQVHFPAFSGADLKGCSFRHAKLDHADFREAENILEADITGAQGLETCFFDDEVRGRIHASAPGMQWLKKADRSKALRIPDLSRSPAGSLALLVGKALDLRLLDDVLVLMMIQRRQRTVNQRIEQRC